MPPSPNPSVQRRRLSFGLAVRARRKEMRLSQEALAEKAGCDRQSINRVETAAYSPSLDRVFKLADALGLSLSDLAYDFDRVDAGQLGEPVPPRPTGQRPAGALEDQLECGETDHDRRGDCDGAVRRYRVRTSSKVPSGTPGRTVKAGEVATLCGAHARQHGAHIRRDPPGRQRRAA